MRSLAGLGSWRRMAALLLRTAVLGTVVLALAQLQLVWKSDRLTVLYLLDQSLSIPEAHRRAMADYVRAEVEQHRSGPHEDRAGVIVFGRNAAIEQAALADNLQMTDTSEAIVDPEYTDLAQAFQLAQAMFPQDSAKRIVVVTDGNENLGEALPQAQALAENGVGIDVVPVRAPAHGEIAIEKLAAPANMPQGQPFDLRVVVNNLPDASDPGKRVSGRLKVSRRTKDQEVLLSDEAVTLEPGKSVFTVRENLEAADFYTYDARFVPDDTKHDVSPQNNTATSFTHVRGKGQVLLIEDAEHLGEFTRLVDQLRRANLQVTVINTGELFTSLAELQPFDTVILGNVPREAFSDDQIKQLVSNTQQMGSGLVMLGGSNSYGAGGWANTELEAAMPVDFQIKNAKVAPVGALALVIDRSGSMDGEKLMMARAAAAAAVDVMSPKDFLSVSVFDGDAFALVPMIKVEKPAAIKSRIGKLAAGGGTFMEPGITMGYRSFKQATDAAIRHMLVLSDGQTNGAGYEKRAAQMRREGITVSTIAVGADADMRLLQRMATAGGGKFYHVTNPKMLPRVFQKEARVVSRPLVFEDKNGMTPQLRFPHEMLRGIESGLPPFTGYVLTQTKQSPLVEVSLTAPRPAGEENRTLLASWTFGLGKTVAFTTDIGQRWAKQWQEWPDQEKFFAQMVRWSMRPTGSQGNFTVNATTQDGKAEVVIDALDKDDAFLNFLSIGAHVVRPDLKPVDLEIRQIAPGRYRGEFPAEDAGSYFVTLVPGAGMAPIVAGFNVGYSREYIDRDTNEPLLASLADLRPQGGEKGTLIDSRNQQGIGAVLDIPRGGLAELLAFDTFRRTLAPASASQDIWHLLVLLATTLFFLDVFVRRVHLNFEWVPVAIAWVSSKLRGRQLVLEVSTMDRLRGSKQEVTDSLESRRAAVRFEPTPGMPASATIETPIASTPSLVTKPQSQAPALSVDNADAADGSYTGRLLKAKRKVWDERKE